MTVATSIFQIFSSFIHAAASISSFAALSTSAIPPLRFSTLHQVGFFSFVSPLFKFNYHVGEGRRFLARPDYDKTKSKCARATLVASWKNPRENKETKAHKESFVDLRSSSLLSLRPSRPGTARGGNCIKVDVGYARAAPSVRGIINSQRRAVTKVRACSLVSRSVSGQANSSSPSSFRHLHHFTPFFLSHSKIFESIRAQ